MEIIVITSPDAVPGEAVVISELLDSGAANRVHLRRPYASAQEMGKLIEAVPQRLYGKLSVHSHFDLAIRYGLGGIHLNSHYSAIPAGFSGLISRSCHSLADIENAMQEDYVFLSPVFDSISKPGYESKFSNMSLYIANRFYCGKIMALGGITPEKLLPLQDIGFAGAAMLGCVWSAFLSGHINSFISNLICIRRQLNI